MFQEPWCFDPWKVARLTFDQIEGVYRRPAAERAKLLDRSRKGNPDTADTPEPTRELPSRDVFVGQMIAEFGGEPARWEADYARLSAEWNNAEPDQG